jgi:glycosyltransferase involved in cell wall biosynthesis
VDTAFNFLFYLDFSSYVQRKNPQAVIEAFLSAFPDASENNQVGLIIKSIGGNQKPDILEAVQSIASRDSRILIIDETLPKAEMNGLISESSCFVSLHRSEGFGRGLAEAMWYGLPVIGTAYSGNLDFMFNDNSYLVNYSLIKVNEGEYVYPSGAYWADPDIDHAAKLMRYVFEHKEEAKLKGLRSQEYIRTHHSTKAVSNNILKRLKTLGFA